MIETVDSSGVSSVEISRDLSVECPYDSVTDEYEVRISFTPGEGTIEYRTFSNWLDSFGGSEISQERLCELIHGQVRSMGMDSVHVSVTGEQYGMLVEVTRE